MTASVEAISLIKEIAGPQDVGAKIKRALDHVAWKTGLSRRRVRGLWNGEAKAILSEEMDALRRAARTKASPNDLLALAADFTALAERASRIDPEMVGPWADAMREIAGRARSLADGD